jgi:DNA-binding transcriptional ArsR family regulator
MARTTIPPVQVITDEETARLLVVPIKRQIIRHLSEKELTQKMLAELLEVSDPTISYHLEALKSANLVKVVRREPESHGIMQNFYRASATYLVADYGNMPLDLKRYFLDVNLERLRGVFAILKATRGIRITLSSAEMEKLADRIAFSMAEVAKEYQGKPFAGGRESLIMSIYGDALQRVIEDDPQSIASLSTRLSELGLLKA